MLTFSEKKEVPFTNNTAEKALRNLKSVKGHGTVFTITLPVPQKETMLLEDKAGERRLLGGEMQIGG